MNCPKCLKTLIEADMSNTIDGKIYCKDDYIKLMKRDYFKDLKNEDTIGVL